MNNNSRISALFGLFGTLLFLLGISPKVFACDIAQAMTQAKITEKGTIEVVCEDEDRVFTLMPVIFSEDGTQVQPLVLQQDSSGIFEEPATSPTPTPTPYGGIQPVYKKSFSFFPDIAFGLDNHKGFYGGIGALVYESGNTSHGLFSPIAIVAFSLQLGTGGWGANAGPVLRLDSNNDLIELSPRVAFWHQSKSKGGFADHANFLGVETSLSVLVAELTAGIYKQISTSPDTAGKPWRASIGAKVDLQNIIFGIIYAVGAGG